MRDATASLLYLFLLLSRCERGAGNDCFVGDGTSYAGNASTTVSGRTCQAWNTRVDVPDWSLKEWAAGWDHNFCRNKEKEAGLGTDWAAPWCYTTDPRHPIECCEIKRCVGKPAAFCPIWCCPSDYPVGLQPVLLFLPPLGITLLVGVLVFLCFTPMSRRCGRRCGDTATRENIAWPDRPRLRSTTGALALFGLFLFLIAGMPVLLWTHGLWEARTSSALVPLQGMGLVLMLLLVRPSDRSAQALRRLTGIVGSVFVLLGGLSSYMAIGHDVCVFRATTLSYDNLGCLVYSCMGLLLAASFGYVVFIHIKFRRAVRHKGTPPIEGPSCVEGAGPSSAPRAPPGRAASAPTAVTTDAARAGGEGEVEMHRVLLHLWWLVRLDLFVVGLFMLVSGAGRLSFTLGVSGFRPTSVSGEGNTACGAIYILMAALLTPALRVRLQLGFTPLRRMAFAARRPGPSSATELVGPVPLGPAPLSWARLIDLRFRGEADTVAGLELTGSMLGRGGFSSVFAGQLGDERVAVKVLSPLAYGTVHKPNSLASLEMELEVNKQVLHENVVRFLGTTVVTLEGDDFPAIVVELMHGGSLREFLHCRTASSSPLTANAQHSIALDVSLGLEHLHSFGWMHRDVKPSNVLLNGATAPRAKIADFGLCTRIGLEAQSDMVGTLLYMAPEVYFRSYSQLADVYSFGILLWELVYVERPFGRLRKQGNVAVATAVTAYNLRPELRGGPLAVPCGYARCASACWATEARARPAMAEVVQWLRALEGSPIGPPQWRSQGEASGQASGPMSSKSTSKLSHTSAIGIGGRGNGEHHTAKLDGVHFEPALNFDCV